MLDEFEHFLFQSFMLVLRLTLQLAWAILRPLLPIILDSLFRLLTQPLSWPFLLIAGLWLHSDHGLLASILAIVSTVSTSMLTVLVIRSGVR